MAQKDLSIRLLKSSQDFQKISGLNINFNKTQLVWIGSEKFSTRSIKTKWKLSWGSNQFKLLGILFNTDLDKMIENNYIPKVTQMEKILKQWNKRSLSPIGKINVIKTRVIPIFNLLFTSLPNPDVKIYETINKTLYDFLWNKNPKIKKNSCHKEVYKGRIEYDKPKCLCKCIQIYMDKNASFK